MDKDEIIGLALALTASGLAVHWIIKKWGPKDETQTV